MPRPDTCEQVCIRDRFGKVISRRRILISAAAGAGSTLFPSVMAVGRGAEPGTTSRRVTRPADLKKRITGPIVSIPTPFDENDAVDFAAVRKMVALGLEQGVHAYELTAGDSQYEVLAYDEIRELTRTLVEAVAGHGIAIAATGNWWTRRAVDYARFSESIGADGIQVLVPSGNEETLFEHYRRLAESTSLGIVLHGRFSDALLERLVTIDSVVAMKEDAGEKYMFDLLRRFGERLAVFGGGQKWRFLIGHRYGMRGYLSTYSTFAPAIAIRFWKALEQGELEEAREIVLKYDAPLFDLCLTGDRPFHAYWRGVLEYFGVAKRYLRRPEPICGPQQMDRIRRFFEKVGLQP